MRKKQLKVGVKLGQGPAPGYKWDVLIYDRAFDEAMGFLRQEQYEHLAQIFKSIAMEESPTQIQTADVRSIENFYELRDKGGILGRINVRVFFDVHHEKRAIVILGTIKKENDGPTTPGDKVIVRRRRRKYRNGDFSTEID